MPRHAPRVSLNRLLAGIGIGAFLLRAIFTWNRSAYLDEATFILTGRVLIEHHAEYAQALSWTYGSYLWLIIAALADRIGGLELVRLITSALSAAMAVATGLLASRFAWSKRSTLWIAVMAGGIMAIMTSAIAVGRWGSYDVLAGAAFMCGIALMLPSAGTPARGRMLLGAVCLFVGFLAKYIVVDSSIAEDEDEEESAYDATMAEDDPVNDEAYVYAAAVSPDPQPAPVGAPPAVIIQAPPPLAIPQAPMYQAPSSYVAPSVTWDPPAADPAPVSDWSGAADPPSPRSAGRSHDGSTSGDQDAQAGAAAPHGEGDDGQNYRQTPDPTEHNPHQNAAQVPVPVFQQNNGPHGTQIGAGHYQGPAIQPQTSQAGHSGGQDSHGGGGHGKNGH